MSTLTDEGVMTVKEEACDLLLAQRVIVKAKSAVAKAAAAKAAAATSDAENDADETTPASKPLFDNVLNRIHVSMPQKRDDAERPPFIPEAVKLKIQQAAADAAAGILSTTRRRNKTERDLEVELGRKYKWDLRKEWRLSKAADRYDALPEVWQGHNIADFVDPDIEAKLLALEKEEEARAATGLYDEPMGNDDDDEATKRISVLAAKIRERRAIIKEESKIAHTEKPRLPRTGRKRERSVSQVRAQLGSLGIDTTLVEQSMAKLRQRSQSRDAKRLKAVEGERARSRSRSQSRAKSRDKSGLRDAAQVAVSRKLIKKSQKKMQREARKGEGDRRIFDDKPKHLFSGKRGIGKNDRR